MLIEYLQQKRVGVLPKDTAAGPFAEDWKRAFASITQDVEEVDISPALSSAAFSVKDTDELVSSFPGAAPEGTELIL